MTFQAIRCANNHGLNHGSPVLARVDWSTRTIELYCRKCKRITQIAFISMPTYADGGDKLAASAGMLTSSTM